MTELTNQDEGEQLAHATDNGAEGDPPPAPPADPIEEIARSHGWTPKDEWRGDPEQWRDPKDFIQYGMKRSREGAEELRSLRSTVTQIGKTSEVLMRRQVEEARREAEERFAGAVESRDHDAATAARNDLMRIEADARAPVATGGVQEFVARNAGWYGKDEAATALAQSVTARLAQQGVSPEEQLRQAESAVSARFPEHFGGARPATKGPASVHAPDTRTANARPRAKGFGDLPADAQKAGKDFLARGMVKTLDDYAKAYLEENVA